MRARSLAFGVLLVGCGRLGFDEVAPASDGAPADGPNATCPGLFCDGFEGGLGGWQGVVQLGTATVESLPNGGLVGDALSVKADFGANTGWVHTPAFKGQTGADRWVRIFVFLPSSASLDMEPFAIMNADDTARVVFSLGGSSVNAHSHGLVTDFQTGDASPPPRDRWVCLELHVEVGPTGGAEIFIDGTLAIATGPVDTRSPTSELELVGVGILSKSNNAMQSLLADEVVASLARVGCER